jgi:hypothetical protein
MKNAVIFLVLILVPYKVFAQPKRDIDVVFLFKMQLYLNEDILSPIKTTEDINLQTFSKFIENLYIRIDTLRGRITGSDTYIFLSISIDDTLRFKFFNRSGTIMFVPIQGTDTIHLRRYILAINSDNTKIFRISGFESDDLKSFFDILKNNGYYYHRRLSIREILRDSNVKDLDLECLYKSIGKPYNISRYPCTRRCSDYYIIIH